MKVSVTNKDIIKLAAPISLSLLIPQINQTTNNVFLGRLTETDMAVSGVTWVFYLILVSIGIGLSNGIQIQMARRAGEGDERGIAKVFVNGLMLAVGLSLVLMMCSFWLSPLIFGYNLHEPDTIFSAINFLYLRVWGLPFIMLTQLLNAFYISIGRSRLLIYSSVAATLVNILFDWLLIFGNNGFPEMGLEGAAIASVLGEVAGFLIALGVFFFRKLHLRFPLIDYMKFDVDLSRHSLRTTFPLVVQYVFGIGGWLVFFFFVEHLGTRELAASNVLRTIFGFAGIGSFAFAVTTNTMVSNIIAQGKSNAVPFLIKKISLLSFCFAAVLSILLLSFSYEFIEFFHPDEAFAAFAVPALRVIAIAILLMSVSTVMFNAVVGTGNTVVNLLIEMCSVLCYLTYCYIFIQRLKVPLQIAWCSEFVYWSSLITFSYLYLRTGRWRGKHI